MDKKRTQQLLILQALKKRKRKGVTSWDMILEHGITKTATRVSELKRQGYPIESVMEKGNGTHYARYYYRGE